MCADSGLKPALRHIMHRYIYIYITWRQPIINTSRIYFLIKSQLSPLSFVTCLNVRPEPYPPNVEGKNESAHQEVGQGQIEDEHVAVGPQPAEGSHTGHDQHVSAQYRQDQQRLYANHHFIQAFRLKVQASVALHHLTIYKHWLHDPSALKYWHCMQKKV